MLSGLSRLLVRRTLLRVVFRTSTTWKRDLPWAATFALCLGASGCGTTVSLGSEDRKLAAEASDPTASVEKPDATDETSPQPSACATVLLPACSASCKEVSAQSCQRSCSNDGASCGNELGQSMVCQGGSWVCQDPPAVVDGGCRLVCRSTQGCAGKECGAECGICAADGGDCTKVVAGVCDGSGVCTPASAPRSCSVPPQGCVTASDCTPQTVCIGCPAGPMACTTVTCSEKKCVVPKPRCVAETEDASRGTD
jgi:hypothetical protein